MKPDISLTEVLEQILNYRSIADSYLRKKLRPGLTSEQISEQTRDLPFVLPDEVKTLYQWHDGTEDDWERHPLISYHNFLPLGECIELYGELIEDHVDIDPEMERLFPIFDFEGEYYLIQCDSKPTSSGKIYFSYHGIDVVYSSLTAMFCSILECYVARAYIPESSPEDEAIIHEQQAGEIKLKWNPMRGTVYDHP